MDLTRIVSLGLSTGIFTVVVWLIRERRLREKYALLWLVTSFLIILLTMSRHMLEAAALAVGIFYPPSLLFLVGVLFLLVVVIGHSVTLSRLSESNHLLAQQVALLRKQLEDEREKTGASKPKAEAEAAERCGLRQTEKVQPLHTRPVVNAGLTGETASAGR